MTCFLDAAVKRFEKIAIPHPFPYQGSKRHIAKYILPHFPADIERLIEPFCGAGAVSIAACTYGLAGKVILNDLNVPLMNLWSEILCRPNQLADKYEDLWWKQQLDRKEFFFKVRDEFNRTHKPHHLLYLLARIVKSSVRYSSGGVFNQSADNRRSGMKPSTMRKNIVSISRILESRTEIQSVDYRDAVCGIGKRDLVYMDPPYQGTSFTRDHRYFSGLTYDSFVEVLLEMNDKGISYIISYDGVTGNKQHGKQLPALLSLQHLHIHAGRSSQATLLGNDEETIESLYLSPALVSRLEEGNPARAEDSKATIEDQRELVLA